MNYHKIFNKLKKRGWNAYRIRKHTGITYPTIRRLEKDQDVDTMLSTHNAIMDLYESGETIDQEGNIS